MRNTDFKVLIYICTTVSDICAAAAAAAAAVAVAVVSFPLFPG